MTASDDLPLAADFAPATQDAWRKLVDGVLKGAPFEKLESKTYDGLKIEPIYPRAEGASPIVGRAAATPWQIMQRVDHPDAAKANAQALHDLENGATLSSGAASFGVNQTSQGNLTVAGGSTFTSTSSLTTGGVGSAININSGGTATIQGDLMAATAAGARPSSSFDSNCWRVGVCGNAVVAPSA